MTEGDETIAKRPVFLIAGPTASGKSALAIDLARAWGGAVVNADAMQLYAELRILTARPSDADLALAPHRLYGVQAATDPASAQKWRAMALAAIDAVEGPAILVGGTGLYMKALTEGLADVPPIPAAARAAAAARRAALGAEAFHAELARRDPDIAARLRPQDTQRTLRAWEVVEATGAPLSEWQRRGRAGLPAHLTFHAVVIDPPPAVLNAAIADRLAEMVRQGAVAELDAVADLDPALPLRKAVGVRDFLAYRAGEVSLPQALESAAAATRQYAKRQRTWFRHQMPGAIRISAQYSDPNKAEIFSFIRQTWLTTEK